MEISPITILIKLIKSDFFNNIKLNSYPIISHQNSLTDNGIFLLDIIENKNCLVSEFEYIFLKANKDSPTFES